MIEVLQNHINVVDCVVSDSYIWNSNKFITDLVESAEHGSVIINMKREGPCCQSIGLDGLLDSIPGLIVDKIVTANQISSSRYPEQRTSFVELNLAKEKIKDKVTSVSSLEKRFAIFIGRSNWQRLGLASYLWNHYKDTTVMSYHYDRTLEYHMANFGLENLLQRHWESRHQVYKFIENLPITFDRQSYPILWDQNALELDPHYADVFCEVVCETFFSGKTFMITEKTLRPIIQRRPFIVQGPRFFLENLKRLGFKTFDSWWDESYDIDQADGKMSGIKYTLDHIGRQSDQTINKWYQEMQPVLEHNVNILASLTHKQIIETEFKSEE